MLLTIPNIFKDHESRINAFEDQIRALDPKRRFAQGWTITRTETGEIISSSDNLFAGDAIVTIFEDGTVKSTISEVVK